MINEIITNERVLELMQARVMSRLFSDKIAAEASKMAIKGGMAMRMAHGSGRRSDDIDVAVDADTALARVQHLVRRAIKDSRLTDWVDDLQISEPKQTTTTARWKMHGTVRQTGLPIHLKVEVSLRAHHQAADRREIHINSQDTVTVYSDEKLLMGKLDAFLNPARVAVRDVYDLYLLCTAGVTLPQAKVREVIQGREEGELKALIWSKLEAMGEDRFQQEILNSWGEGWAEKPRREDWEGIKLGVGMYLEGLLAKARQTGPEHSGVAEREKEKAGGAEEHHGAGLRA